MIISYSSNSQFKPIIVSKDNLHSLPQALWIDLVSPTLEEEYWVENILDMQIPTLEEMREIELSSRLYQKQNILYMTATMVAQSQSKSPQYDAATFALTPKQLITIRYIEPQAFLLGSYKLPEAAPTQAIDIFLLLIEATVDRLADVLEFVTHRLDDYAARILPEEPPKVKPDYQQEMRNISSKSTLNNKARESLMTFTRLITFFNQRAVERIDKNQQIRIQVINTDLGSLSDYTSFISTKVNFLLDATLGMISIEQSNIIKIFSVAAVIFLPPTLIATIYGMNFKFMPELSFQWGYSFSLFLMVISAWLPYKYFKHKRWL